MLRISEIESSDKTATLRLEGCVSGPWVKEVREACERVLDGGRKLTLDVDAVTFIARAALPLFEELARRPVAVVNCPPFLSEQLKGIARCATPD